MFGTVLRLMAAGEAGRRVGDYTKNLATRYLVLSAAGTAFLGAIVFAILAGFWALTSRNYDPVVAAEIMAVILACGGFLIVLIAYGITGQRTNSVSQALTNPADAVQSQIPSMDGVGRKIEDAVRQYGPARVTAAAVASGLVAGLLAKRFHFIR